MSHSGAEVAAGPTNEHCGAEKTLMLGKIEGRRRG